MGERETVERPEDHELRDFMQALIADVHALEKMLEMKVFETGRRRIGAEQELFLIDSKRRPAPVAVELLQKLDDPRLVPELARFNLEANLSPRHFEGRCLSEMEAELDEVIALVRNRARELGANVALAGILPTIHRGDLSLENMMPEARYRALNDTLARLRGGQFQVRIEGVDELDTTHDNVMLEACNTSFQVHFQVAPDEFARLYNMAQAITGPVLAAAVNSPFFLGKRLWQETRIALFMGSIDSRSSALVARGLPPRVSFGDAWVRESVMEIYQEQIARFRVVLSAQVEENPLDVLRRGGIPPLAALRLHGGTVYRWNRACYGISDGKPHLRIENRVLPSGPSVVDEIANAAFFFGLMSGLPEEHQDITEVMEFDHAKENFLRAARDGLDARMTWLGGEPMDAAELILGQLLPLAKKGLERSAIDTGDIERYLGVIEARVRSRQTGSRWALASLANLEKETLDVRERTLVAALTANQLSGRPVHAWPLATPADVGPRRQSYRTVGQFMSTDLFTVRPGDLIDLAASVMDWKRVRHVPVEDDEGRLLGVVSHRMLLRLLTQRASADDTPMAVRDVMRTDLFTVTRETPTLDAMRIMRRQRVGCLPVVDEDHLVGIITERDLVELSAALLERHLQEPDDDD